MEGGAENGCEVLWAEAVFCVESNLLRQQRERAPSFYRIPLPGGGVLTASLPHMCEKRKGKSSGNTFSVYLLCTLPAIFL